MIIRSEDPSIKKKSGNQLFSRIIHWQCTASSPPDAAYFFFTPHSDVSIRLEAVQRRVGSSVYGDPKEERHLGRNNEKNGPADVAWASPEKK